MYTLFIVWFVGGQCVFEQAKELDWETCYQAAYLVKQKHPSVKVVCAPESRRDRMDWSI